MLCLVAIDESHLYAIHGRLFHNAMRLLLPLFFVILFKDGEWYPLFLAMTATSTLLLVSDLLWSKFSDFCQWYISIHFEVTGDMGQVALPALVCFLGEDENHVFAYLFVNF